MHDVPRSLGVEWGVAATPLRGESASGDQHAVVGRRSGSVLVVLDGIGHGPEAAHASHLGVLAAERNGEAGAIALVRRCHEALIGTRGAVMSVAMIDVLDETLTWISVGNVAGFLRRADPNASPRVEELLSRGGVIGLQLPTLQASVTAIAQGDTIVMATDGIRRDLTDALGSRESPPVLADRILREHARGTDDALVLVARYIGRRGIVPGPA